MSPGDFYFVPQPSFRAICETFYTAITKLGVWAYLHPSQIYCFAKPIADEHILGPLRRFIYSQLPTSDDMYETVMRSMESIAKFGWSEWKSDYIHLHRQDIVRAAENITRGALNAFYNPSFRYCRERLHKEFVILNKETDEILNYVHRLR
jgi:hypothetical protein